MPEEAIPTSPSPEATSPPLPAPTYSAEPMGERTVYTCLIPDAGHEDGLCGHKTTDEGFMTQHMAQRHSGIMIKTTLGASTTASETASSPQQQHATSPRTAEQQEHPAQIPPPGSPPPEVQPVQREESIEHT